MNMTQHRKKQFIVIVIALTWEISRLGLLWNVNNRILSPLLESVNPFYLLWLISPAIAIISGYLILLFEPEAEHLRVVLFMSRCFYIVLGLIGLVTLLYNSYQIPFTIKELGMLLGVILLDSILGLLQYYLTIRRTH